MNNILFYMKLSCDNIGDILKRISDKYGKIENISNDISIIDCNNNNIILTEKMNLDSSTSQGDIIIFNSKLFKYYVKFVNELKRKINQNSLDSKLGDL